MLRSSTSTNPAVEEMKDSLSESGRETVCTLTGAETETDTTEVKSGRVTVIATVTGGTTEITTTARTEIDFLHTIVITETGSLSGAGTGTLNTQESGTVTAAPTITTATDQERTGKEGREDMATPTATNPVGAGGGRMRVENPGR